MLYTRRDFGKLALASLPAAKLLLDSDVAFARTLAAKPMSEWAGVKIGMNVPYNFKGMGNYSSDQLMLDRCVKLGVEFTELRAQPVELFLGSPVAVKAAADAVAAAAARGAGGGAAGGRGGGRGAAPAGAPGAAAGAPAAGAAGGGRAAGGRGAAGAPAAGAAGAPAGGGRAAQTPEQMAAAKAEADATKKWRMGVSMDKVKEFRKRWNDAGVNISVVKWDGIFNYSDDEIDYAFEVSKALGATALSSEISEKPGDTKHIGSFADKHKMPIGYHGHTTVTDEIWEAAFAEAKYNYANVDLGHYVAGFSKSPVPFIKKHPDRITHVHIKDRKLGTNGGANLAFGMGDTPIKETLQLMRANKWKFVGVIEMEYQVPQGSDLDTELAKTMQYCKDCLV